MSNLVIFDLDYTLTKQGTWGRFVIKAVKNRPHIWLPLLASAAIMQWRYKRGHVERIRVKQKMMKWAFPNWPKDRVEELAKDFARKELQMGLRPGAIRALKKHRERGDTLMIASAAVDVIVKPIAEGLDIQHWVATDMKWKEGYLQNEFASSNCYGEEKLNRVKRYLDENPLLKQTHTNITMYSDSYSDLAIMQFVDVGVAVNPDKRLVSLSKKHNFEIVDWLT